MVQEGNPDVSDTFCEFTAQHRSLNRKHGDPFPLPRAGSGSVVSSLNRRVDAACGALNRLASAHFDRTIGEPPGDYPMTKVQSWMLADIRRRVANYGERPSNLSEDDALRGLAKTANLYVQEANGADPTVKLDVDRIKILNRKLTPIPARELAPPTAITYLDHFQDLIERDTAEIEALRTCEDLVEPFWDAGLKRSLKSRQSLYIRLHSCGLLAVRRRIKARVGVFAVPKKDGAQRLIIDCRQANQLQQKPPGTHLATPAGLAELDFSSFSLEEAGYDVESTPCLPSAETGDVGDCFYNFSIDELSSWFGFGDTFTVQELRKMGIGVTSVYDDQSQTWMPVCDGELLHVCFGGIPMGWSWALYFAQEIVSHQCLVACGGGNERLIKDKSVVPRIRPDSPPIGVYVDNVHTFGGRVGEASNCMQQIQSHFEQLGIPFVVDGVDGSLEMNTLGLTFDFRSGVRVRAKSDRAWKLYLATRSLLNRRRVSGGVMRVWLGHVNFHFMLCRPALSVLSSCYKFAIQHLHHRHPLWPSVRRELRIVMGLIFTVERNLSASICPEVHVGDSSDKGFGLMVTTATVQQVKAELQYRERWRFRYSREPTVVSLSNGTAEDVDDVVENSRSSGSVAEAGLGTKTQYGRHLLQSLRDDSVQRHIANKKMKLFGPPQKLELTMIEGPGIPEVAPLWGDPTRWDLIVAAAWKHPEEHINIKEGRVCLMSLRRLCRSTQNMGKVCLTLTDNMTSALCFEKGWSNSHGMNRLCQRAAAYAIGGNLHWRLRHVKSECNVADGPSRRWGSDLVRTKGRRVNREALGEHVLAHSFEQGQTTPSFPSTHPGMSNDLDSQPKCFLELFAGCERLTKELQQIGLRALPGIEVSKGGEFDLLNPAVQEFILCEIRSRRLWWVHLGTPCTVWSRARHNIKNVKRARQKERHGVALALFSARVVRECLRSGVRFSLENPASSRLWDFGPIASIFENKQVGFFTWDMCRYNTRYKKSTSILTNFLELKQLSRRCQCVNRHVQLKGTERVKIDGKFVHQNKTLRAGEYPITLCKHWAQIALASAPSSALGKIGWRDTNEFLYDLKEAANSVDRSTQKDPAVSGHEHRPPKAIQQQLNQAAKFIRTNPVVFGQFTRAEADKENQKGHEKHRKAQADQNGTFRQEFADRASP